jgi:two-component system, LytTR family, response regulator
MSKVKILVVEDEFVISMQICDFLEDLGYEVLPPVTNYESAVEALKQGHPDIALLDIQLKGKRTGIDVAKHIKNTLDIPFIFLTSNADARTIDQAKRINPNAYLLKPFTRNDLFTSIELALYNYQNIAQATDKNEASKVVIKDAFFIKKEGAFYKVRFDDIVFAKSEHVYIELHTTERKIHLIRSTIQAISDLLPEYFYHVHRSFIINLNFLESINTQDVLVKGQRVPISKQHRIELLQIVRTE